MPYKDIEKRRKYQREYMRRKRKSGEYETPYQKWKREQLKKNPSSDVSFEGYLKHCELERISKQKWKEQQQVFAHILDKPKETTKNKYNAEQAYLQHVKSGSLKYCPKCRKRKPISEFTFNKERNFVSTYCKSCGSQLA